MSLHRVRCFFDIEVDGVPLGRVIFELFSDACPKTSENFRGLCTGEKGYGKTTGKALHYRNVKFHRVIKDFMVQAGDFSAGNGTGGESIYGGQFEDENFDIKHDTPFLLSMANRGKDTNGSQFFITTQNASHLDGKHVVFGRVINGQEVVVAIENLPVDNRSRPLQQALISNCGELVLQLSGQLKSKEKKKKKKKLEELIEAEDEKKKKREKKKKKHKQKKEKQSDTEEGEQNDDEPFPVEGLEDKGKDIGEGSSLSSAIAGIPYKAHPLASVSSINPDEIPEVPKNRFLDRGFQNRRNEAREDDPHVQPGRMKSKANVRFFTKSGRKVKGRGLLRYRTPSRSRSRSRSLTPPHWRQAQRRTVTYERYQRQAEEQQIREKEIEERRKRREERHRLQQAADDGEDGPIGVGGPRLVSVIKGRVSETLVTVATESLPEDRTSKDWRLARHETMIEDKENRDRQQQDNRRDLRDLRQKLKGKVVMQSFVKGGTDFKKGKREEDDLELDDTALDYEAPSDNEEEEPDGAVDAGEVGRRGSLGALTREDGDQRTSFRNGREARERERHRRQHRERDREDRYHQRPREWRDRGGGGGDRYRGERERRGRGWVRGRERRSRDRSGPTSSASAGRRRDSAREGTRAKRNRSRSSSASCSSSSGSGSSAHKN